MKADPQRFLDWRWQMKHQLRDAKDYEGVLDITRDEQLGLENLGSIFKSGITPYYAALVERFGSIIRLQAVPDIREMTNERGEKDPLREKDHSHVPEVVHAYPDRVAFCVAMLCPVYCRYCYRKRRDDEEGLHYNRSIIARGIEYIAKTKSIRDVLITGGDPFIASDESIEHVLSEIAKIEHVEIVRFGTRTPVTLPYRITPELCAMLAKYHPVWLNTHFNCAEEITPEASLALRNLVDAGIPVGNQAVLLKGVNDTSERMAALCRKLVANRVRPYYVFQPHRVVGADHFHVPVSQGMAIMRSLRGTLTGFAIPQYVLDTPGGKIPLTHNHILGNEGNDLILENLRGELWREPQAMALH